jgi:hypothetical protein
MTRDTKVSRNGYFRPTPEVMITHMLVHKRGAIVICENQTNNNTKVGDDFDIYRYLVFGSTLATKKLNHRNTTLFETKIEMFLQLVTVLLLHKNLLKMTVERG